jgi:hypothetical protein
LNVSASALEAKKTETVATARNREIGQGFMKITRLNFSGGMLS